MCLLLLEESLQQSAHGIRVPQLLLHPESARASILEQQLTAGGLGDLARRAFLGALTSQARRQFHRAARKAVKALPVEQRRALLRSSGGNLDRFLSGLQWAKSDLFWPIFALSMPMLRREMFSLAAIHRSQLAAFKAALIAVADRRGAAADERPELTAADVAVLVHVRHEADGWLSWFRLSPVADGAADKKFKRFLGRFVESVASWLPENGREPTSSWIFEDAILIPRIIELWNACLDDWFLVFEAVESLWE